MIYVYINIQKLNKNYCIHKELDFSDAKSIVLPVGPREKLFDEGRKSNFHIIISQMPTDLALLAQKIFHTSGQRQTFTEEQLNQNIE